MDKIPTPEITQFLHQWNDGDDKAIDKLLPFVYDELKRQARRLMSAERADHTLQPTALVHEAFIRLSEQTGIEWRDRSHFYGFASRFMRQILVDHARRLASQKRGSRQIHFSLDEIQLPTAERAEAVLALDEAIGRLEQFDARQSQIIEMRFFGGMTNAEIASTLGISESTILRDWESARRWLYRELSQSE